MHIAYVPFVWLKKTSVAKTNRLSFLTNIEKQQWTTRRCPTQPMPFDSSSLSAHDPAWFSCSGLHQANLYNLTCTVAVRALWRYGTWHGNSRMPLPCDHWRIQGAFRATPPEGPKWPVPPPPPRKTRSIGMNFVTALDFFFTDMSVAWWTIFCVFEVQNLKIFFGIPKSSRNWMLTHPLSI